MSEWEHYAEHSCGEIHRIPFGDTGFLTNFGSICQKCGRIMFKSDLKTFIGRYVWKGELLKPSTWFNFEWEKK